MFKLLSMLFLSTSEFIYSLWVLSVPVHVQYVLVSSLCFVLIVSCGNQSRLRGDFSFSQVCQSCVSVPVSVLVSCFIVIVPSLVCVMFSFASFVSSVRFCSTVILRCVTIPSS